VIGALVTVASLGVLGGGAVALWADRTQRDAAGYVTSDEHEFSTTGSALVTERIELGSPGVAWLYSPALFDVVRIRVAPMNETPGLFVGIARSADVDRYLADVERTHISDFWSESAETIHGGSPPSTPGAQDFWVASSAGIGPQTVRWDPANGSWTVVVMNTDAQPGIDVATDLGAALPTLSWIAGGLLAAGVVFLSAGALLVAGGVRRAAGA
jgi:hypothetical protein